MIDFYLKQQPTDKSDSGAMRLCPFCREATQEEIHTYLHRMRVRALPALCSAAACHTSCAPANHMCADLAGLSLDLSTLQEKGWDVGQTIEKLLQNGARISAEAHEIVRIPGLLTDADMIGGWEYEYMGSHLAASLLHPSSRLHLPAPAVLFTELRTSTPRSLCRRPGVGAGQDRGLLVAGREAGPARHAGGWVGRDVVRWTMQGLHALNLWVC